MFSRLEKLLGTALSEIAPYLRVAYPKRVACLILGLVHTAGAEVVINEFMAASSERRLHWDQAGVARVGSGIRWMDPAFVAAGWSNGLLPAGWGFSGLATDLTPQMKDKTPTLYLLKEFTAAASDLEETNQLVLSVQYNDGFVAFLNGREMMRCNFGPTNHLVFAGQPAYNTSANTNVVEFALGPATNWFSGARNVLAIQAANGEQPSTSTDASRITRHLPTPEFFINAGLSIVQTNGERKTVIALGRDAGGWRYLAGRYEPSGGVVDPGLVTRTFAPPLGEEDDYNQPAEFVDWVELRNTGAAAVDLKGWSLTDDPDEPGKWRFPTNGMTTVPANGYLVVLCDDREEANAPAGPASSLHASFKLSDSPGYIGLYDAAGQFRDWVTNYPSQVSYCSYGRRPDGAPGEGGQPWGFLGTASPRAANIGEVYEGRVEPPEFLDALGLPLPGGIYPGANITIHLRAPTPESTIRCTLNGSEPTEWNGVDYTMPVTLSQPLEKTAIVVRARAFRAGWIPSKIKTYTYFLRRPQLLSKAPMLALTAEAGRNFYAPEGLLAIVGGQWSTVWIQSGPTSYNMPIGNGEPFERESHLEYYYPAGIYPTNQEPLRCDIGLRVSSSPYSRPRLRLSSTAASPWPSDATQKPSFNLHFNGDFADPLDYALFTNYTARKFETLRLRAGKNDMRNPFIIDEFVRRLYIDLGQVGSRGLFCTLWMNGVYKGVFNLCERFREPFFQEHFRSDLPWDVNYINSWVSGDGAALTQLYAVLDKDLTNNLSNWQAVTNRIEIDNACDYYLLNIYGATWDWPHNNFVIARERSSGPLSKFRFGVWDAEGAFNIINTAKPASYNSLTNDLILQPNQSSYNAILPRIFRRLATSPEFRLRFADRINQHMFNGGVLDDRDPDGVGPARSHFQRRLDQLVGEAGDLVLYNTSSSISLSGFAVWVSPTAGRRSYLLGPTPQRQIFRNSGFWPVTEPPVFSQHGGAISPGFMLGMTSSVAVTGQTATIFYTRDNSDPRIFGGSVSSAARVYAEPIELTNVVTIQARARNDTTGEWSPLTAATFAPDAEPARATNLVLAEIMYHPPDASAAEEAARYSNADDFEFVRLMNIGPTPIDLFGARFIEGIIFDFSGSPVRYLNRGQSVLIVPNLAAFQFRYGHGMDSMIAGVYTGSLANSGERLQLVDTNNVPIRAFTYDDVAPWPVAADGDGPSLILASPWSDPDHAEPASWTVSAMPGGMPGGVAPVQTYQRWRELSWGVSNAANVVVSGPSSDPDADGIRNLLEYAFGLDPRHGSEWPHIDVALEDLGEEQRMVVSVRIAPGASGVRLVWEASQDLVAWSDATTQMEKIATEPAVDGSAVVYYGDKEAVTVRAEKFMRLRVDAN